MLENRMDNIIRCAILYSLLKKHGESPFFRIKLKDIQEKVGANCVVVKIINIDASRGTRIILPCNDYSPVYLLI